MKCLIFAAFLLPLATAHLCMLFPEQRGAISGLNTPGSDDCNLEKGDCGDRKMQPASTTLWAGMKNNIIYQKNLDHYNPKMPGVFVVRMGTDMGGDMKWTTLATVNDSNTTSLYLYNTMVDIPNMEMEHAVIQVVYNTSNPDAPASFFQCADVAIRHPKH